jgi:hypothetical protein
MDYTLFPPSTNLGFGQPLTANAFAALSNTSPSGLSMGNMYGGTGNTTFNNAVDATVNGGAAIGASTPEVPEIAQGGFFGKIGGLDGLSQIAKGIGTLGQMFAAFKGLQLAKDQFAFQKKAYQTNLENQTQTYNTSLEDRAYTRYQDAGLSPAEAEAYIAKHKL